MDSIGFQVLAVLAGKAVPFRGGDEPSAIAKAPVDGAATIGLLGLLGDEQADLTVHGGLDKAIHHYPHDHYGWWQGAIGPHRLLAAPGGFGENIATLGLTEENVCLGDRYRLGTALVEVSQGRQPCWKLDHHFARRRITARVVATGRCGWYYRVIEGGMVAAGERMVLVDQPLPQWSVARMFALLIKGDGSADPAALRALTSQPLLAEPWRRRARELAR